MNIPILIANILTALAFFAHTFAGDGELKIIQPPVNSDNGLEKQEKWTMARCGWHWISFDLLMASVGLGVINFTDAIADEKTLLQILSFYFGGYALVWIFTIYISKTFTKNYLKLGQWILLASISGLIFWGTK